LTAYSRLVAWSGEADILSRQETEALLRRGKEDPSAAHAALEDALTLRAALHRLFVALPADGPAEPSALATLNAMLASAFSQRRLAPVAKRLTWVWTAEAEDLDRPLWPVALSAAELLVSDDLRRVRQCAGDDCGFLFLDTGRGPGRRWCDMAHCGNRAKARRHYRRTRVVPHMELPLPEKQ
jgi:predicted RNA-binding Zn ribbon-like protein